MSNDIPIISAAYESIVANLAPKIVAFTSDALLGLRLAAGGHRYLRRGAGRRWLFSSATALAPAKDS